MKTATITIRPGAEGDADIAGMMTLIGNHPRYSPAGIARQDAEHARAVEHELARLDREVAETEARRYWDSLALRSEIGEAYLRGRGLDVQELIARGVVHFDRHDNPCVALHDLVTGEVINVLTRHLAPEGGPKVTGMRGCGVRGALVGRVAEIDLEGQGPDVVVIVEGATDALAGVISFPGCVVLGAHSAGSIVALVEAALPQIIAARGWMLLVPHADARDGKPGAGERACIAAARTAIAAGLVLDTSLRIVDLGEHKDLADAHAAGWRWAW